MRTVDAYSYRSLPLETETLKLDIKGDYLLQQKLQVLQNYEESIGAYEYRDDLDRYLYRGGLNRLAQVKKLYIKGDSSKQVPKQTWNIETTHFKTNPVEFFDTYNTEFEEF